MTYQSRKISSTDLASDAVWTELSESEWGRNLPEKGDHVHMFDPALGVGIVLTPKPDKLVKMVGAQDGPVPGQAKQIWSLTQSYSVGLF